MPPQGAIPPIAPEELARNRGPSAGHRRLHIQCHDHESPHTSPPSCSSSPCSPGGPIRHSGRGSATWGALRGSSNPARSTRSPTSRGSASDTGPWCAATRCAPGSPRSCLMAGTCSSRKLRRRSTWATASARRRDSSRSRSWATSRRPSSSPTPSPWAPRSKRSWPGPWSSRATRRCARSTRWSGRRTTDSSTTSAAGM